jgi:molecular chaperone GrpE
VAVRSHDRRDKAINQLRADALIPSKKAKDTEVPISGESESLDPTVADAISEDGLSVNEPTVELLQVELAEAHEARMRALADFSNYQRRATENERRSSRAAQIEIIRALLPAVDHLGMALDHADDAASAAQLKQGVELAEAEFLKAMGNFGVTVLDPAPGHVFDPNLHQAVMREASEEMGPNHVLRVLQVGYEVADQVIRPAQVIVSTE